jgi:hypothetical protein
MIYEIFLSEPFEPEVTMLDNLFHPGKFFLVKAPALLIASFNVLMTSTSKDSRIPLPGSYSNLPLWVFCMTL